MKVGFENLMVSFAFSALVTVSAFAQAPAEMKSSAQVTGKSSDDPMNFLSVAPKSLPAQRLHEASFPGEAEIRCGFKESCALGLARGFVLGGDLLRMATTPVFQPMMVPGKWLFYDGFVGYQFLRQVDDRFHASGSLGYRGFSYEDSSSREVSGKGLTFRIAYAQDVTPVYTQGVTFAGFSGQVSYSAEDLIYRTRGDDLEEVRTALKRFYTFSQNYPRIRLGMPADFEIINWKASHIDLPNHLRSYARVEPFYIENDLAFRRGYSWNERNFGLRLALTGTYESAAVDAAGRYAMLASAGVELATSKFRKDTVEGRADTFFFDLPERDSIAPYWELMASYQF